MGIIKSQAIKGSIWSYIGVILGFINLGVLSQKFFTTEQVGLTQVLISFATIFSQVGTLGMGNVAARLFPHFRNQGNKHFGFIGLSVLVAFGGFLLVSLVAFLFEPVFVSSKGDASNLFADNYFYTYPLIFFLLFFALFDSYNRMLFNAVLGTFLREFLLRAINTVLIALFIFKVISFEMYVLLYVASQGIPTLLITISLWRRKQLTLRFDKSVLTPTLRREVIDVSVYGIVAGLSSMLIQNVDRIMLNSMINLSASGIYGVTFFFGSLILISQRAVTNISIAVVSESWKTNDLKTIDSIYVKSSVNQFIIGMLVFVGIWGNIDNVFLFLKPEYEAGKWVIFWVSLSNLITVLSGVSIVILSTSKYYRYQMWFMIFLIVIVVASNLIFIPLWGLTGASVASFISLFLYTFFVCFFLYRKFKIQPLRAKHLSIVAAGLAAYFASELMPSLSHYMLDIPVRSALITIVFGSLIIFFRSSDEIDGMLKKWLNIKRVSK
jgi:O-antigen/teichoic acid export membrane protein